MKATATITMSVSILEKLRAEAKKDKRSVSQHLEMLVERHFEKHPIKKGAAV